MPRYEYRCKSCRHVFEVERHMGEANNTEVCPECGWEGVRLFSVPHLAKFIPANPRDPEQWK